MEVTKQNFKDCLVEITKDIEEAHFISIDTEFTGLTSERNILPFDTSEEYYEKLFRSTKGFIIVQLGISLFKKDPAENVFDFNKLFSSGVGVCNEKQEEKLRQEVKERQEFRQEQIKIRTSDEQVDTSSRNFLPVPENEKELIDNAKEKIQQVIDIKFLRQNLRNSMVSKGN
ncbi:hypothetical protein PVAND_006421 [Polypedilum vanderplanki]|uniref:Uncharacterized protein n=1 Tax=Polypedilum vanderplanki TaxID=319348 RepID=A0A9J6C4U8_POLVA|nr:hypothetical protein PVAND_006421 [Polypedilum vanderplanki]